jgi:hypothetical protein
MGGDLTPRPRGGWQVGTRLLRQQRALVSESAQTDPAPDVYAVSREGASYTVRHYPSREASRPCCVVAVTVKPGQSEIEALAAVARHCERKHEEKLG